MKRIRFTLVLALVLAVGIGLGVGYAIWGWGGPGPGYNELELKYDTGRYDSSAGSGPGWGHSVRFSPPDTPFIINKVKVYAGLSGTGYEDQHAKLEIWDQHLETIYSREVPTTEASLEKGWIRIEPNITVDGDFRVVFFTNRGKTGGFSIGCDLSGNKRSEMVREGGMLAKWPRGMEEDPTHPIPEAKANWIIRVIGNVLPSSD